MKKLINAQVCEINDICQVVTNSEVAFSGRKIDCFDINATLKVWVLENENSIKCVFLEDNKQNIVRIGPQDVAQVMVKENYVIFEKKGKWFGQYFSRNHSFLLGTPLDLKCKDAPINLFQYSFETGYILTLLSDNKIVQQEVSSFKILKSLDSEEYFLMVQNTNKEKYYLYNNNGRYTPLLNPFPNLFFVTGQDEGIILTYNASCYCYQMVYSGKYLHSYQADEVYLNGKIIAADENIAWFVNDKFIVPDEHDKNVGTLYKIVRGRAKKVAQGKMFFIYKTTLAKSRFPDEVLRINGKDYIL